MRDIMLFLKFDPWVDDAAKHIIMAVGKNFENFGNMVWFDLYETLLILDVI